MTQFICTQGTIQKVKRALGFAGQKNKVVFRHLAIMFSEEWTGDRNQGKRLVKRFVREKYPTWKEARAEKPPTPNPCSDDFLASYAWRKLRMEVLVERGPTCEACGANAQRDRVKMNIDHIKPRRKYPELALEKSNLQVLCDACNHGKGNWDETDWRVPKPRLVKGGAA